jgi:Protein of unknown function (DUF3667)
MSTSLEAEAGAPEHGGSPAVGERMSQAGSLCANCAAPRSGAYCSECGQPLTVDRLSLRGLVGQLAHTFDLERGLLGTTIELFRHPRSVIVGYLGGRTVPYTNPVKHFVLAVSIAQVLALASGFTGDLASGLTEGTADVQAATSRVIEVLERCSVVLAAPAVLVLAAAQRRLFQRAGWTYAEHLASALFLVGNQLLLWIPALVVSGIGKSVASKVLVGLTLLGSTVYYTWAACALFGGSTKGAVLRALAVLASSAVFAILLLTLVLGIAAS